VLIAASRWPSDVSTVARFSRSARICFSIAARTSCGGLMYGIIDYTFAITQLAQTTPRRQVGKIEPDRATQQQQINEAEGEAAAILSVAAATAEGIRKVAEAIKTPGGQEAVQLRVAEQYVTQFGNLAQKGNTLVVPATLSDLGSMISMAMSAIRQGSGDGLRPNEQR
jgi:hypothetical protein